MVQSQYSEIIVACQESGVPEFFLVACLGTAITSSKRWHLIIGKNEQNLEKI